MSEKTTHWKEFRILYVSTIPQIENIKNELLREGARILENSSNSLKISSQACFQQNPSQKEFPNIHIRFHSDELESAKDLASFDADLVIVDEKIGDTKFTFEQFKWGLERFSNKDFLYTTKRIIVIINPDAASSNREFQLSLANVRAVILPPNKLFNFICMACKELFNFREHHHKTSLCISGGGVEGYIYSIGVLQALNDCFKDKSCNDFDIYCGVSSGAILSSALACGSPIDDLKKQLERKSTKLETIHLNTIFDPAFGEVTTRFLSIFKALPTMDLSLLISRLQRTIPVGFFRGEKLKKFLERQIQIFGVPDNMSSLQKELYINVTDQDSGENVVLGDDPWSDVKISQAIRASTALPPFYLPEKINGHWFTDGQLTSNSDFQTAIQKGAGLVVYIDPMTSFVTNKPGESLRRGGYFTLLQAVKSIIETRSKSYISRAMDHTPDVDFVIFRPTNQAMETMSGNPMKYTLNIDLISHGYRSTLDSVLSSYDAMSHKFEKHGIQFKEKSKIEQLLLS